MVTGHPWPLWIKNSFNLEDTFSQSRLASGTMVRTLWKSPSFVLEKLRRRSALQAQSKRLTAEIKTNIKDWMAAQRSKKKERHAKQKQQTCEACRRWRGGPRTLVL